MNDLDLAHLLADAADAITLPAYRSATLAVSTKFDGSVVTDADMATETELRRLIAEHAPFDGVVGEEHGVTGSDIRRWFIDPIDGTSSFVAGKPEWATMVALEEADMMVAAVVSSPALGRRWYAEAGGGTWARPLGVGGGSPSRLSVSPISDPSMARVSAWPPPRRQRPDWVETVTRFLERAATEAGAVQGLEYKPSRDTGFPNAGVLVAAGALDGFLLCGGGPWDLAALALVVEEAGGRFSDLQGGRRVDTGAGLFTNGHIHDDLLAWAVGA